MKKSHLVLIIVALVIGELAGYFISQEQSKTNKNNVQAEKPRYWIDPMEPTIHYPGPGKSHMNMDLVPIYAEKTENDANTVKISPAIVSNLGVRTATVEKGTLTQTIETVGYVEPNQNKISHVHTYADGWVRSLLVKSVDEPVKEGQLLLGLYSPTLISGEKEYLIAIESGDKKLIEASEHKLLSFKISSEQINRIKKNHQTEQLIDMVSPQNGIISELNIREGMHVTPENEIMSIVDLSSIWIIAQIFELQAEWVKEGQTVQAKFVAYPGKVWTGKVDFIYPEVDPTARTLKIRMVFNNSDVALKPNMYANITILAKSKTNALSIPSEALIRSGQGDRVIIALGNGQFKVRRVTTGIETANQVEILSGLQVGDQIVISGQFLIDSEANLKASIQRIENPLESNKDQLTITGEGIIIKIDVEHHLLTLKHEAIAALDMPKMTMDFAVDKNINLSEMKPGSHVEFTIKNEKDKQLMITKIRVLDQAR
ncbi:MAG: efflux RND transporter periplasmic adaptor subunit [Candidatus Berkiellales bacterium]